MMKKDLCEISVTRIDSRKFLKVGESEIEIKDFEINSSGDGDTKLTVVIDKGASVFDIAFQNKKESVNIMKRLCPACFTELPEKANYCPACGKCMRENVEQTVQYIGCSPVTTIVGINDCAINVEDKTRKGEKK